jgi:hypothetical protein
VTAAKENLGYKPMEKNRIRTCNEGIKLIIEESMHTKIFTKQTHRGLCWL